MKKLFEKNETSGIQRKNTVIMIVSLLAMILFIVTALQPAVANAISNEADELINKDACTQCIPQYRKIEEPQFKTCDGAIIFAISYMKEYVKDNLPKEHYFPKTVDLALLIYVGLMDGIKLSGFKIEIDQVKLQENIEYWVNELYGPQLFNITKFLAVLGGISIGITTYLLTLCKDDSTIARPVIPPPLSRTRIKPRFSLWSMILRLLGV